MIITNMSIAMTTNLNYQFQHNKYIFTLKNVLLTPPVDKFLNNFQLAEAEWKKSAIVVVCNFAAFLRKCNIVT